MKPSVENIHHSSCFAYVIDFFFSASCILLACFLCSETSHPFLYPVVNHSEFSLMCKCLSLHGVLWVYVALKQCWHISDCLLYPASCPMIPAHYQILLPPVSPCFWRSNWLNKNEALYQILINSTVFLLLKTFESALRPSTDMSEFFEHRSGEIIY